MSRSASEVEGWAREHLAALHRYFRRRASPDDCDDLVSEVFAIAWRRRDDVPDEAVLPWLYRTAGFVLANHRRVRRDLAIGNAMEVGAIAGDHASDVGEVIADDAVLAAAWRTLGQRDREVLLLTAWEGLNGKELAAALGISTGGAGAALFRARQALAAAIADAERSGTGTTQA